MCKWKDLNRDGKIDALEEMFAEEMLCTSREEHIALFGNSGRFGDEERIDADDCDFD